MAKLKEYARGRRLNDDANKGKQAIDMNWCQEGHGDDANQGGAEEEGEDGTVN